ncbi:MAG: hypothetical protein U1G07_05840 [Verrucomicrobiota bacterium]
MKTWQDILETEIKDIKTKYNVTINDEWFKDNCVNKAWWTIKDRRQALSEFVAERESKPEAFANVDKPSINTQTELPKAVKSSKTRTQHLEEYQRLLRIDTRQANEYFVDNINEIVHFKVTDEYKNQLREQI